MKLVCIAAYLIGFGRLLLIVLVLMAFAIFHHHQRVANRTTPHARAHVAR
jgi:hypothetical protein